MTASEEKFEEILYLRNLLYAYLYMPPNTLTQAQAAEIIDKAHIALEDVAHDH